jgi:hypothetical protein
LESVGSWLFFIVVLGVASAVAFSFAMNAAADDLYLQVTVASSAPLDHPRTAYGMWLSAQFASDMQPGDYAALRLRADQLDHRADRIREMAGVGALGGLLLLVVTMAPSRQVDRARNNDDDSSPLASTTSTGTV